MTASVSRTEGVHHVGLTVPQLEEARIFFVEGLGFEQVGEKPRKLSAQSLPIQWKTNHV